MSTYLEGIPTAQLMRSLRCVQRNWRFLQAAIFHNDNLEFCEQFNVVTGYEKRISNPSCSYAAFLPAVRARNAS